MCGSFSFFTLFILPKYLFQFLTLCYTSTWNLVRSLATDAGNKLLRELQLLTRIFFSIWRPIIPSRSFSHTCSSFGRSDKINVFKRNIPEAFVTLFSSFILNMNSTALQYLTSNSSKLWKQESKWDGITCSRVLHSHAVNLFKYPKLFWCTQCGPCHICSTYSLLRLRRSVYARVSCKISQTFQLVLQLLNINLINSFLFLNLTLNHNIFISHKLI